MGQGRDVRRASRTSELAPGGRVRPRGARGPQAPPTARPLPPELPRPCGEMTSAAARRRRPSLQRRGRGRDASAERPPGTRARQRTRQVGRNACRVVSALLMTGGVGRLELPRSGDP